MKVAILSDGIPGHENQSIGILNLLEEEIPIKYDVIVLNQKFYPFRALIKIYKKLLSQNLSIRNAKKIKNLYQDLELENVDLLIATGGNTAHISASLGKIYNLMTIQNGKAGGVKSENFTVHITLNKKNGFSNIQSFFPPNRIKPFENIVKKNNKALFLIGGNGSGYVYRIDDFISFVKNIENFSIKYNISPIIATSRRTPKAFEDLIYSNLRDICDSSSVWFHKDNSNYNFNDLFKSADMIFVTEESSSMIAEAICTGLPVCTLFPEKYKKEKRHQNQLRKYIESSLIRRISIKSRLKFNEISSEKNIKKISMERLYLKNKILKRIRNE